MKKVLKIVGWLLVLGVLLLIASYNDHDSAILCTFGVYVCILSSYYGNKLAYKEWKNMAEYDEFYKRFTVRCNPLSWVFYGILGLMIFAKFFNCWGFVIYFIVFNAYDLWDRRYNTTDIKQDLILEKLENMENRIEDIEDKLYRG